VQPILLPLYARSGKSIEVPDKGSWEPEKIIRGMMEMEMIDEDGMIKMLEDMYLDIEADRDIGNGPAMRNFIVDRLLPTIVSDKLLPDMVTSSILRSRANTWLREWMDGRDIDAIVYENYTEGRIRSIYRMPPHYSSIVTDGEKADMARWTEAEKQFNGNVLRDESMSTKQKLAAKKELFGNRTSAIVWNTGQVKSASADDVGFSIVSNDIRASLRFAPPMVVTLNPGSFDTDSESRMSMRHGMGGRKDAAMTQFVDQYEELRRYGEIAAQTVGGNLPDIANPYLAARVLTGRLGAMQQEATRDYALILRDMADHNIDLADMDEFLTAQHALNGGNAYIAGINPRFPDGGTGMMNADAQAVIMRAQAAGRYGDMNRIAEDWRQMLRDGLTARRDAGLINADQYNAMTSRYTHYVPLRGAPGRPADELFEDYDSGEVFGRGMSTQGRGMPRRLGRASRAEGVTSQVAFVHEDTMRRIARNEIGQRFLRLTMLVNDPMMAEVIRPTAQALRPTYAIAPGGGRIRTGEEVQTVHDANWMNDPQNFGLYINQRMNIGGHEYEPGDLVVIRINNPTLAQAIAAPNRQLTDFEQALRTVNNAWRFVTTGMGNPTFAPVNAVRDIGTASLSNLASHGLRDTGQMLRRYPRAFIRVFRDAWFNPDNPNGSYRRFVDAGGDQVYWRPNDLETKNTDFDELARRVERRDPNDRGLVRTLLGWYPAFFTAAETASRLAQFEQRLATGSSMEQAALAARDITVDFAKGGKRKSGLNTYYMFLNASIQGSANVVRATKQAVGLAPALVTFGAMTALMARALGGDDEEREGDVWDNIPDYEKAANIILMDPTGSGKYLKIPLPYGFSVFYSAGVRMADAALGKATAGDAVGGMLTDALNSFNPFGGSGIKAGVGNIVSAFTPTMARPAAEIALNQNFMGRPIFPEAFGRQQKSDASSYFPGTPEFYVDAARILNENTGGDMFESGIIDMSPNTMQYLAGYYLSGMGRTVDRIAKVALSAEPVEVSDIPMLRSFAGDARSDTRAISERYNGIAARTMPDINRAEAFADPNVGADIKSDILARGVNPQNIALGRVVEQSDKEMRKINKALRTATPKQRERLLEARQKAMNRVIRADNRLTQE
jgi:hypothetical protein